MEQLTEKQQEEIKVLKANIPKAAMFIGALGGLRTGSLLLAVLAINLVAQSDAFVIVGSFLSAFIGIQIMKKDMAKYNEEIRAKVTQILENK